MTSFSERLETRLNQANEKRKKRALLLILLGSWLGYAFLFGLGGFFWGWAYTTGHTFSGMLVAAPFQVFLQAMFVFGFGGFLCYSTALLMRESV